MSILSNICLNNFPLNIGCNIPNKNYPTEYPIETPEYSRTEQLTNNNKYQGDAYTDKYFTQLSKQSQLEGAGNLVDNLNNSFDVEVDIWFYKSKLYLGHDEPKYEFDQKLLEFKNKLWFHAKNLDALPLLKK